MFFCLGVLYAGPADADIKAYQRCVTQAVGGEVGTRLTPSGREVPSIDVISYFRERVRRGGVIDLVMRNCWDLLTDEEKQTLRGKLENGG